MGTPTLWVLGDNNGGFDDTIATLDVETGTTNIIGTPDVGLGAIAYNQDTERLVGTEFFDLLEIDQSTGEGEVIGNYGTPGIVDNVGELTFASDGSLYTSDTNDIYQINPNTAETTEIGEIDTGGIFPPNIKAMEFQGDTLYATNLAEQLFTIDLDTLATNIIGTIDVDLGTGGSFDAFAAAEDGPIYGIDNRDIYSIDPSSGAAGLLSTVDQFEDGLFGAAFFEGEPLPGEDTPPVEGGGDEDNGEGGDDTAEVPSPGALLMMATGLVGLGLRRLRS